MTLNRDQVTDLLRARYPGVSSAATLVADADYTPMPLNMAGKAYGRFILWTKALGLFRWLREKLDCDDWAWLFKAYVIIANALSKRDTAVPVFVIWYYARTHVQGPHAVNCLIVEREAGHAEVVELEPQPGQYGGLIDLTQQERGGVWAIFG